MSAYDREQAKAVANPDVPGGHWMEVRANHAADRPEKKDLRELCQGCGGRLWDDRGRALNHGPCVYGR